MTILYARYAINSEDNQKNKNL